MPANPHPLDAAARDELARKAELIGSTLGTMERVIRDSFDADLDWTPELDAHVQAAHDALAALLAAVERGAEDRWQLTRAKSALENYGRHHPWCEKTLVAGSYPPPCNCGYEQAIRDADPVNVANAVSGANAAARTTPTGAD